MTTRPSFRSFRAGLFAGLTTLAALTSCVQDQEFLIIEHAVPFASDCSLDSSSDVYSGQLVTDVYFSGEIHLGISVANLASPYAGSNTGIDDSEIVLETAEVSLSFSGGGVAGGAFEAPIPSISLSGGDTAPVVIRIPTDVVDSLNATMSGLGPGSHETLVADIIVKGRKAGAISPGTGKLGAVESRSFTFPIDVCYQCLADCTTCAGQVCPAVGQVDAWYAAGENAACGGPQGTQVTPAECWTGDGDGAP